MAATKVKLDYAGIGSLMRGPEMEQAVASVGKDIVIRAGRDYKCTTHDSGQRKTANVYPISEEAKKDTYENNTLLKAMK